MRPVLAVDVPADDVPAPARVHQPVRLGRADAAGSVVSAVVEAQAQRVAAGGGDGGEGARVDGGAGVGHRHRHRLQGVDPVAQPGRQHLFDLGQGTVSRSSTATVCVPADVLRSQAWLTRTVGRYFW